MAGAAVAMALGLCLSVSAPAAPPSLTLEATDAVIGEAIHATAELSEGPTATGEISFEVFGSEDSDCSGPALDQSSATVSGEGEYVSEDFEPTIAGPYYWTASYSGDGENEPAEAACGASSTVGKASPGMSGSARSGVVGTAIGDEVTLSGGFEPGGEVTFSVFAPVDASCDTALDTSVATLAGGAAASDDFVPQQTGEFRWSASYSGDANNEPAELGCEAAGQTSRVEKASPGLSGSPTATAVVGNTITDQATVSGGFSPDGNLVFRAYGPDDADCAGPSAYQATVPLNTGNGTYSPAGFAPAPGVYRWTIEYSGDGNNEEATVDCNAPGQTSTVATASPGLAATATSTVIVGNTITDQATVSGGFSPDGNLVFRAYGPNDETCAGAPAHQETVPVNGNGLYAADGFAPTGPGVYQWTVEYSGDGDNSTASLGCNASNQASAVGTVTVGLTGSAGGGTVGTPVTAIATIVGGAAPGGQLVFKAFPPGDTGCSGSAAFTSSVNVKGNGSYRSAEFTPARVGNFRWTVAYSGDANHQPASLSCGKASSGVTQAKPSIAGSAPQQVTVGTAFRDAATLQGGYTPGGAVTFRIYGPIPGGCTGPAFVNTVAVTGNGSVSSDPFVPLQTGRYSFTVSYSGDAENQAASEPCDSPSQVVQVVKRTPKLKPRAVLVGKQISIRGRLSGAVSPSGRITFRLYGPEDKRCRRKPEFSGAVTVKRNGTFALARYLATKAGTYRLSVGYSGDRRNRRVAGTCATAQRIKVN